MAALQSICLAKKPRAGAGPGEEESSRRSRRAATSASRRSRLAPREHTRSGRMGGIGAETSPKGVGHPSTVPSFQGKAVDGGTKTGAEEGDWTSIGALAQSSIWSRWMTTRKVTPRSHSGAGSCETRRTEESPPALRLVSVSHTILGMALGLRPGPGPQPHHGGVLHRRGVGGRSGGRSPAQ